MAEQTKRKKKPFIAADHFQLADVVTFPGNPGSGEPITGDIVAIEGEAVRVFGTWNAAGDKNLFWLSGRFCFKVNP